MEVLTVRVSRVDIDNLKSEEEGTMIQKQLIVEKRFRGV